MDEKPALGAVAQPYLEKLVGQTFANPGPAYDLLKLLVEGHVTALPVDVGVNVGEEERQKRRQVEVERVFPGTIEIVRG